jgi:hypothetical protein
LGLSIGSIAEKIVNPLSGCALIKPVVTVSVGWDAHKVTVDASGQQLFMQDNALLDRHDRISLAVQQEDRRTNFPKEPQWGS